MITETRTISFSVEALAEAVLMFGRANQQRFFSHVHQVYIQAGHPPVVMANVSGNDQDAPDMIEFSAAETAAMLILLCRRQQIPLPHHADKSLGLRGGELTLLVSRRSYPHTDTGENATDTDETSDTGELADGA